MCRPHAQHIPYYLTQVFKGLIPQTLFCQPFPHILLLPQCLDPPYKCCIPKIIDRVIRPLLLVPHLQFHYHNLDLLLL